jgi:CRP/FNR family transcriptional regulator
MATAKKPDLLAKVDFKKGETIFTEGDAAEAVFVVDQGSVRLSKNIRTASCNIETLSIGDVLGVSAMFPNASYSITAVAIEPTICLRVTSRRFDEMMRKSPEISARIMSKLAARLIHSHFRLANFSLMDPMGRLIHQLLAETDNADEPDAVPVPFDLPEVLAVERGAVDSLIRRLLEERHIKIAADGTFKIVDRSAIDRYLTYLELHDRFERLSK